MTKNGKKRVTEKESGHENNLNRIRVGYLSGDWRNHPMGRLTMRLVTGHTSNTGIQGKGHRDTVCAHSLSYGENDQSSVRTYVSTHSEHFIDLENVRNDQDAAEVVEKLELDVVVDLTAHTYKGRIGIACGKPAPIVINYLGYPGTTGCQGFDYSLTDRNVAPPEFAQQVRKPLSISICRDMDCYISIS